MGNHVHKLMPYHKLNTYQKAQHAKRKKTPAKPRAHTLQRVQTPSAGKKCAASRTHTNVRARARKYLSMAFIYFGASNKLAGISRPEMDKATSVSHLFWPEIVDLTKMQRTISNVLCSHGEIIFMCA